MANIRLVAPSTKNLYASAFPLPIHASGLERWLRATTDEEAPTEESVQASLSDIITATPYISPIENVLSASGESCDESTGLYVVSSRSQHFGASIILNPMCVPLIRNTLHADTIMLIPSSTDELLALAYDKPSISIDDSISMIRSINATEVRPDEVLDDGPWILHGKTITRYNCIQKETAMAFAYAAN